jgi:hypothetical protein
LRSFDAWYSLLLDDFVIWLAVVEEYQQRGGDNGHCGDVIIRPKGTAKARSPGITGDPFSSPSSCEQSPSAERDVKEGLKRGAGSGVLDRQHRQGSGPPRQDRGWSRFALAQDFTRVLKT